MAKVIFFAMSLMILFMVLHGCCARHIYLPVHVDLKTDSGPPHIGSSGKHSGGEGQAIKQGSKIVIQGGTKVIHEIEHIASKISDAQNVDNFNNTKITEASIAAVADKAKDKIEKAAKDLPKTIVKDAIIHADDVKKAANAIGKALKSIDVKKVKNILKTVVAVASFIEPAAAVLEIAFAFIPEGKSPELEKLEQMEKQIDDGFNRMSTEIKEAVAEISKDLSEIEKQLDEGFQTMSIEIKEAVSEIIAENREIQFEDNVQAKTEYLMKSFKSYLKYPGDYPDFGDDCKTNDPSHIVTTMLIILKNGGLKKLLLKKDGCVYKEYAKFQSLYYNYIKYISIILPFCESIKHKNAALRNDSINAFIEDVKTIDELLNNEKITCEKKFWTTDIDNKGLEILKAGGNAENKAKVMQQWLADRYGEYDEMIVEGKYICRNCQFAVFVTQDKNPSFVQCNIPESFKRIPLGDKTFMFIIAQPQNSLLPAQNKDMCDAIGHDLDFDQVFVKFAHSHNVNCVLAKQNFEYVGNKFSGDYSFYLNDGKASVMENNVLINNGIFETYGCDYNGLHDLLAQLGDDEKGLKEHFVYLVSAGIKNPSV